MDLSSIISTLMSKEGISGISQKTGASSFDIKNVLSSALPQMFGGADKQNTNESTSQGFVNALQQHASNDTSNLSSFFGNVDLLDGSKIVGHLLGKDGSAGVAAQTGVNSEKTSNILSSAAPLVMSLLGKQFGSEKRSMGKHLIDDDSEDAVKRQAQEVIKAMNEKTTSNNTSRPARANTQSRKAAIASSSKGTSGPKKIVKQKKD